MQVDRNQSFCDETKRHVRYQWVFCWHGGEPTDHQPQFTGFTGPEPEVQLRVQLSNVGLRTCAPLLLHAWTNWTVRVDLPLPQVLVPLTALWKMVRSSLRSLNEFEAKFSRFHSTDVKPQRSCLLPSSEKKKKNVKGELWSRLFLNK